MAEGRRAPLPYVEDGLSALVEASYRRVAGRPPTTAERLSAVAGIQADPQRAALLAALVAGDRPVDPLGDLFPPPAGPAWR